MEVRQSSAKSKYGVSGGQSGKANSRYRASGGGGAGEQCQLQVWSSEVTVSISGRE